MIAAFPTIPTAPVTQIFGNYNPALYGGDRRHKGIDYGVISGSPVYACMPGTVAVSQNGQTGYGRNVRISHPDGSLSIYGHLSRLLVFVGDVVEAGQEIGKSGGDPRDGIDGDGLSTGAHLHWEIRPPGLTATDQTAVDPLLYCLAKLQDPFELYEVVTAALNVRSGPDFLATMIGSVRRKEIVKIAETQNGWGRIFSLRPEWVSLKYLEKTAKPVDVPKQAELTDSEKIARLWAAHPELH